MLNKKLLCAALTLTAAVVLTACGKQAETTQPAVTLGTDSPAVTTAPADTSLPQVTTAPITTTGAPVQTCVTSVTTVPAITTTLPASDEQPAKTSADVMPVTTKKTTTTVKQTTTAAKTTAAPQTTTKKKTTTPKKTSGWTDWFGTTYKDYPTDKLTGVLLSYYNISHNKATKADIAAVEQDCIDYALELNGKKSIYVAMYDETSKFKYPIKLEYHPEFCAWEDDARNSNAGKYGSSDFNPGVGFDDYNLSDTSLMMC
ncbi:MAG: hypothetical protein QM689_01575 [Oscillospiraceae bacterium]